MKLGDRWLAESTEFNFSDADKEQSPKIEKNDDKESTQKSYDYITET